MNIKEDYERLKDSIKAIAHNINNACSDSIAIDSIRYKHPVCNGDMRSMRDDAGVLDRIINGRSKGENQSE